VSKDYSRLRPPAELAQRLKTDPELKRRLARPDLKPLAWRQAEPEDETAMQAVMLWIARILRRKPEPESRKVPIRHAIIQDIVRRRYPDGKVPQKVSVAALKRDLIDKMWGAACSSEACRDACKRHGVSPKKPPDANTVARAIGRRKA
jgi:hypothetical protein